MQARSSFFLHRFLKGGGLRCFVAVSLLVQIGVAEENPRTYENKLTRIKRPKPLLADYPEWVEPIRETNRWESPPVVNDAGADLHVRAWRWSYNARGILEIT